VALALFEDETDVGFVEEAFVTEVCLSDSIPDLFALTGSPDHAARLLAKLAHLMLRDVRKAGKGLRVDAGG